jgi:hypothetical protein
MGLSAEPSRIDWMQALVFFVVFICIESTHPEKKSALPHRQRTGMEENFVRCRAFLQQRQRI